jgi:hypothetical protein
LHKPPFGSLIWDMATTPVPTAKAQLNKLAAFRQAAYGCFKNAADGLFELLDALLLSPRLDAFPELSCAPVFRRQWPSLYAGLRDGAVDRPALLALYVGSLPPSARPLLVGDHTAWARPQARTLRDRAFQHQPTPIRGQKPITIGHGYSTLGVVPEAEGSWFLPLLHERIPAAMTPAALAAAQLGQVRDLLCGRPLALYDSEYGSGSFLRQTAPIACDLLFRLRPNRKLYRAPPPYSGSGRPALHGPVFRLRDPATWGPADGEWRGEDRDLGPVEVRRWDALHLRDAPQRPLTVFRIERAAAPATRRHPRVVWLGWCGQPPGELAPSWRAYLRRYVIEHWYRFANQSLHWKLPRLGTPEQGELWSGLMVLAMWQLWLARRVAEDQPRPWQKAQTQLTPGRVHAAMGGVLARIGTPARAPKPRGKSPGWPKGKARAKRVRYPVLKRASKGAAVASKPARAAERAPP